MGFRFASRCIPLAPTGHGGTPRNDGKTSFLSDIPEIIPVRCCCLSDASFEVESCARAEALVKTPNPVSAIRRPIEQRAKASRTRGLKKADCSADVFFIIFYGVLRVLLSVKAEC